MVILLTWMAATLLSPGGVHLPDAQFAELAGTLLRENPELQAATARVEALVERVPQQRSLPQPDVTYRLFLESPETRVGPQEQGFELRQMLPGFRKRSLQAGRAEHLAAGGDWQAREVARGLLSQLKRAYWDAAFVQEALATNAEERALLERFEQIALKRYATGEGRQQSVIKVQTDLSRLADRESRLTERLHAAERRIAQLIGRPEVPLRLEPIELLPVGLGEERDGLEEAALSGSPALRARREQIEADRVWIERRRRDGSPDFAVGLGFVDVGSREDPAGLLNPPPDNGQDIWSLMVNVKIPLYRGQVRAGVAEAEHGLRASLRGLERDRDRLRYEVQESLLRLDSFEERVRLHRDALLPQAAESLASAEAAYTTGQAGFLDLLDAERILFELRLNYQRLLADSWIALADLERAVARPLPATAAEEAR